MKTYLVTVTLQVEAHDKPAAYDHACNLMIDSIHEDGHITDYLIHPADIKLVADR